MEALVEKSQGLFIYMETIIKFLVQDGGNLGTVDKMLGQASFPEAEKNLDALYKAVIESAAGMSTTSKAIVPLILGFILASSSTEPLQPRVIHALLPGTIEIPLSTVEKILKRMSPILIDTGDGITVSHTSVLDFISDQGRCSESYWTDPDEIQQIMAAGCFEIMEHGTRNRRRQQKQKDSPSSGLRFNICKLESSYVEDKKVPDLEQRITENITPELLYSCANWLDHALRTVRTLRSGSPGPLSLSKAVESLFCSARILFLLEVMNLCGRMDAARGALLRVHSLQLSQEAVEFGLVKEVAHEISSFIEQCLPAISISTPHLYLSLAWIGSESKLWTYWRDNFSRAQILNRPLHYSPGRRLLSFDCPPKVDTFAMSHDGRCLASGSRDGHIRIWDLASGVIVHQRQLNGHHFGVDSQNPSPIDALGYYSDSGSILCASGSSILKLNPSTLLPEGRPVSICYSGVQCIAVSKELQLVAVGLEDGAIAILNAGTLSDVRQWQTNTTQVHAIAFETYGTRLVSASADGLICTWDVQSGECILQLDTERRTVLSVAFSFDRKLVVAGDWIGDVQVWDAVSGEAIGKRWKVGFPVFFLAFFPDGSRIVTAVARTRKWVRRGVELPPASEARCYDVRYGDCIRAEPTSIQIWNSNVLTRQTTSSPGHTDSVDSVAFSPDGKRIVSGSNENSSTVRVWDTENGKPVELAEMRHNGWVSFVAFSPDGKHIASGGRDKVIRIWDARTGNPIRALEGHTESVTCGAYSPDGTKIVSGSWDKTLKLWDAVNGEQIGIGEQMTGPEDYIMAVCFSPDGSHIASASEDSTIRLWDGHTGEALGKPLTGHDGGVHCIAFSPDGTRIASGGEDNTVRLWDVKKRTCIGEPLKGHSDWEWVTSVAFSLDGTFVFSSAWDGIILCWDTSSGEPVGHPLIGHTLHTNCLAISRDGTRIATGSRDKTIRIWDNEAFHWETDRSLASCGLRGPECIPAHISDDGWIRKSNAGLLLWVPPEHRMPVCNMSLFCISTDETKKPLRILWDKLLHGEDWSDVYAY